MEFPKDKQIILFDGICNYCNDNVKFIIKHDSYDSFRFATIQSQKGQEIIKHLGLSNLDSVILYVPGKTYYTKSKAVFKILKSLNKNIKWLTLLDFLPNVINDIIYEYVAQNRYKWFGKKEVCVIPDSALKFKFLE